MELSIDTSTEIAGIALSEQGHPLAEVTWTVGMNHTTQLMPGVERLLHISGRQLSDTTAVFVALGPGSFAGIRVALSAAKGISFSLSIPLVGVSALEVEAFPFASTGLPVCAVHEAGRAELAVATYRQSDGEWRCLRPAHLTSLDGLGAELVEKSVLCGEISGELEDALRKSLGDLVLIPPAASRLRRAGNLAALGWARLLRGEKDDPATLQPIYMRRPHITVPKHEHQGYNDQPGRVAGAGPAQ
ncbi:MAG: tRNA (adenosine(37)-N6)-threonylcarbamoyltransferase complex dimerization subunit type 1 TsaB [Chloroflexi bacterium]|nr:tRNA (adenosine(37)-N6)-threonylcarbamoyltransferase complex dimerization subunit type 1 TsaB [Chloroflexota bacterium]